MSKFFYPVLIVCLLIVVVPYENTYAQDAGHPIKLVAAGGGSLGDDIREHLLSLSSVDNPNILIIPQATQKENWMSRGRDQASIFAKLGAEKTMVLDLSDPEYARNQIADSDGIWISGGGQQRLIRALESAGVADAIREKVLSGTPAGGTSAGAAIMSDVMIANSNRDEETGILQPVMSHGLAFWPEVIVDQHFSERDRLERLEIAVRDNPELTGVGIDEGTAVIYDGNGFNVVGIGSVTVVRAPAIASSGMDITVLQPGETYNFKD